MNDTIIVSIILCAFALLYLVGIAKNTASDFKIHPLIFVLIFALIIGLEFIQTINIKDKFLFTVGALLLYLFTVGIHFAIGKWINKFTTLGVAIILGGLAYASSLLAKLTGNTFFATSNWAYALIIGTLAFIFSRNGRYSFTIPIVAMLLFNGLLQIGSGAYNLTYGYLWSVVAGVCGCFLFEVTSRIATKKPSKLSYYFEAGRMDGEE